MKLRQWVALARKQGASDLHLEAGLPLALRVRGRIKTVGEPIAGKDLLAAAKEAIPTDQWGLFLERRSHDAALVLAGVACRLNVFQTARGVGFAVRLLSGTTPTLERLNLHPDLKRLVDQPHGLVLISGATGSGKSSTLAALVEQINKGMPRHVVTIEQPIEYHFRPRSAYIRQREVGRDTPSFEQALLDALREDPDVIVVGEMRRRETMQLTLDAAETGHLVLATMHSSTPGEALSRIVSAFPAESQAGVRAQLAACLHAVVCQSLVYRAEVEARVPECQILVANHAVRSNIRQGELFKLGSAMETGASDGMWTLQRYRRWLDDKRDFHKPRLMVDADQAPPQAPKRTVALPPLQPAGARPAPQPASGGAEPVVELGEDSASIDDLIAELEKR